MKLTQERYKKVDSLLGEIVNGMSAVAILGATIILFAALWGIIYHDKVFSEKRMELSPTVVSFNPVP